MSRGECHRPTGMDWAAVTQHGDVRYYQLICRLAAGGRRELTSSDERTGPGSDCCLQPLLTGRATACFSAVVSDNAYQN